VSSFLVGKLIKIARFGKEVEVEAQVIEEEVLIGKVTFLKSLFGPA
jgi:hypothetical protein